MRQGREWVAVMASKLDAASAMGDGQPATQRRSFFQVDGVAEPAVQHLHSSFAMFTELVTRLSMRLSTRSLQTSAARQQAALLCTGMYS